MEFREYIVIRRKKLGLSQRDLALALGYTDAAISKIEAGLSSPPISILPLLANELQVSLSDFLALAEDPAPLKEANPPYDAARVGRNIRAIRLHLGLRQNEAASKIGVSKRTLITYEKGDACPSLDVLGKILADCPENPVAFFYGTLYPEIQSSSSFWKRGPHPVLLFILGFLVGGGLLSAILVPITSHSDTAESSSLLTSGSFGFNSSDFSSDSVSFASSGAIQDLGNLGVVTQNGNANAASTTPNGSLILTAYTGPLYTESERQHTTFVFSFDPKEAPAGTTLTATTPYPSQVLQMNNAPAGSFFLISLYAYKTDDPSVKVVGTPLAVTVLRSLSR
jgi:transcriptional regulator with XRE-family HTH domain